MDETGLYRHQYVEFWKRSDEASGYDIGKAPIADVPPPTVRFSKPLRWWSWDSPRRVRALLNIRDQQQAEILRLGTVPPAVMETPESLARTNHADPARSLMKSIRSNAEASCGLRTFTNDRTALAA
jgi:hypothetical protein